MDYGQMLRQFQEDSEVITKKLEYWAQRTGDKTFFYYGDEDRAISYREFNLLSNRIARNLQALGIKKGDRISLFLRNALMTTLAMFGIWKIGAVFCPVNFNFRGRLLSYQLNDTNPRMIITEQAMIPLLNDIGSDLGGLDLILYQPRKDEHDYNADAMSAVPDKQFKIHPFQDLLTGDGANPEVEISFRDPASLIYTSGTTGPAKGVLQPHRWVINYIWFPTKISNQDDVVYTELPLYHVAGAFGMVGKAVFNGNTVGIWERFSPTDYWNRINKIGATMAVMLDVMIPWLMMAPESPADRNNTLNKVVLVPLPSYHHDLAHRFGIDFVTSVYASSEVGSATMGIIDEFMDEEGTPPALWKGLSKEELRKRAGEYDIELRTWKDELKKGFIARPCAFHEAAVLNDRDEPCAPGEVGQFCFRPRVPYLFFLEYLNKPETTLAAFRNQWYHSGDMGSYDEDGVFYFADRKSGFMRSRGENFSSFQVEDIMTSHPAIGMAAVFPIPAEEGGEDDVVAFLILKAGETIEEGALRDWMKTQMPKYMWPKYIRFVDDFPKTPTLKVEKYKLKEQLLAELGKK